MCQFWAECVILYGNAIDGKRKKLADTILSFLSLPNRNNLGDKQMITIKNKLEGLIRTIGEKEMKAMLEEETLA